MLGHAVMGHAVRAVAAVEALPTRSTAVDALVESRTEPDRRRLLLLLSELVALALLVEVKVHVLLAQVWIVAAVPHAAVWVVRMSSVTSEVLDRLVLDQHGLSGELIEWRAAEALTLLIVEDSIVLGLGDLLRSPHG